jgi:putative ABC transport system permease protein
MKIEDLSYFSLRSLTAYPQRTLLILLAMAIGVASVVVLVSLGEGARRYVVGKFSSLGTNLLIVLPGRSETTGGPPPLLGETPRDLTLEDSLALLRSSAVRRVAPIATGSAPVSWREREREAVILGSTSELYYVRQLSMARGRFLPPGDPARTQALCVLGDKVKKELFGNRAALGEYIRIGDRRFRVIGVLSPEGQSLGIDMGDVAVVPVASAQSLFNTYGLFRVLVEARHRDSIPRAKEAVLRIIAERHDGEDDVTVITQDAVLSTFDRVFNALTLTVAGIAAVSLAVAGVLIMNVMLISVSQRTREIGLLKALGAPPGQILRLFLAEAASLSLAGAVLGLAIAFIGARAVGYYIPEFPVELQLWAVGAAIGISLVTGMLFGILPARKAAALDPVRALSGR